MTPDVKNALMYAVARDVTERRAAEAEVKRLADEQAALRRVATLVARDASQAEVFAVIADECAQLLRTEDIGMVRYEADGHQLVMASSGTFKAAFPPRSRHPLGGDNAASLVFRTGRPARIDDYDGTASGPIADAIRPFGLRCAVATPIVVEGRVWGAMIAGTSGEKALPLETESRLGQFTELIATAIANAESRAQAGRLAEEQAALRRVATLVATEASPGEVFAAVAEEPANVLGDVDCALFRDEGDGTASVVAVVGAGVQAGTRLRVGSDGLIASVLRTGTDGPGPRSAVGCPVVVGGRVWGTIGASRANGEAFASETETRIGQFAELVATAIANADARAEVERLAEEQAALRRVAIRVAEGAPPATVFDVVATEIEGLLGADGTALSRYESDDEVTIVAHRGLNAARLPPGTRTSHRDDNVTSSVRRWQRPVRIENHDRRRAACARASRRRSSWMAGCGASPSRAGGAMSHLRRTARSGWRNSRSCSRPPSPTPTAATSSPPRAPVCSRPATTRAVASSATCTTARSSGSCTPSSR